MVGKVLLISLDGETLDLIQPLVEQGYMPHLKRWMEDGVIAPLTSVIPPVTAPAWASFMTGKHPGKHGVFDFRKYCPSTGREHLANSTDIKGEILWRILSEAGKKVSVINLPMTYPVYEVNGVLVSGFNAPSLESDFTYPPTLKDYILKKFPGYDLLVTPEGDVYKEPGFSHYLRRCSTILKARTALALDLMNRDDWDVFMVQYQIVDAFKHLMWGILMARPEAEPGQVERARGLYRLLDRCLYRLLDAVNREEVTTFLISDHGHGDCYGTLFLNNLLWEWGFLSLTPEGEAAHRAQKEMLLKESEKDREDRTVRRGMVQRWRQSRSPVARAAYTGLRALRSAARNLFQSPREPEAETPSAETQTPDRLRATSDVLPVDWTRTRACAITTGTMAGSVFINLKGRNPNGIVEPGKEYEELREALMEKLRQVQHPKTGSPMFQSVHRVEEVYSEFDPQEAPDLVAMPVEGFFSSRRINPLGFVQFRNNNWAGTHRLHGILMASGPHIRPHSRVKSPSIVDLMPTILYLLEIPIPDDVDGRVLEEMLDCNWEVRYRRPRDTSGPIQEFTAEEGWKIQQRLEDLGYL